MPRAKVKSAPNTLNPKLVEAQLVRDEQERKDAKTKAAYQKIKDEPAIKDLVEKLTSFAQLHSVNARNGVGKSVEGGVIHLSAEGRLSELDKAAGQMEILNYLQRQIS